MAKKIEETAKITFELEAQNFKPTLVDVERMVAAFDALPQKARDANPALKQLSEAFKKIAEDFKKSFGEGGAGINGMQDSSKEMKGLLKILKDVRAGFEAIQKGSASPVPKDLAKDLADAINKVERFNQALAKAGQTTQRDSLIKKGTFGLDSTTLKGADAALRTLETRATALRTQMQALGIDNRMTKNPVVQENKAVQKNIGALGEHRAGLVLKAETTKLAKAKVEDKDKDFIRLGQEQAKRDAEAFKKAYAERFARVMGERQGRLKSRYVRDLGKYLDDAKDSQLFGEWLGRMQDGRQVAKANTTAFSKGEGRDAQISKGARGDQGILLEHLGVTKQMLSSSIAVREVLRQAHPLYQSLKQAMADSKGQETERTRELTRQLDILKRQAAEIKATERRKDPKVHEEERANSLLSRVRGVGGAALMGVQANLMFNYSVLSGITGTIRSAITNSVQLEASFRNVQAVTATTSTEMQGLENQIRSVAATSKFSANEVAQAALVLGQAGLSSKEVGEALPAVLTLAAAAGTSLAQAVDLATSVLGVFDKKASDTADIANKITQAANTSKVSVDKLALGLQYAGNIAAQSGISFEETTAAMAVMSNAGIRSGSTMGTGLRQFLIELQKPSKEFLATLSQLGLSLADVDLRAKGLTGVVQTLRSAGFVASDAIKSFDVRGAAAFNALLADPAALDRQHQGLLNTRAAVEANEIQMNSLQAQTTRLTTSFSNLASTGLDPFVKLLTIGARGLATFTQWMADSELVSKGLMLALAGIGTTMLARHIGDLGKSIYVLYQSLGKSRIEAEAARLAALSAAGGMQVAGNAADVAAVKVGRFGFALKALSVSTWIGLALTVGVGLFEMFDSGATKAAKAMDGLKAKSNEAKAAFEEKDGAVKSLTKKIEDLEYRENSLKNASQKDLKPVLLELKSEFTKYGLQVDVVNDSFTTMLQKLRDLKGAMAGLADAKLGAQLSVQEAVHDAAKTQSDKARSGLGSTLVTSGGSGSAVVNSLNSFFGRAQLTPEQQQRRSSAMKGLLNKTGDDASILDSGEKLQQLVREVSESGAPAIKELAKRTLTTVQDDLLNPLIKTVEAQGAVETTKAAREQRAADKAAASAKLFDGRTKTFDEAAPKDRDVGPLISAATKRTGRPQNALEQFMITRGFVEQEFAKGEAMEGTPGITAGQKTALHGVQEKLRTRLASAWTEGAQDLFKQQTEEMVAGVLAGKGTKEGKAKEARELRASRDIEFSKLGVVGTNAKAELDQRVTTAKLAAANQTALDKAGVKAGKDNQAELISSLQRQAAAFESKASANKKSTTLAESLEDVEKLVDEGVGFLLQGKAKALQALTQEQLRRVPLSERTEETKVEIAAETQAMSDQWDDKVDSYLNAVPELEKAVLKRLDKSGRAFHTAVAQEKLKLLQTESEDAIYAAGEESRKLALEVAAGTRSGEGLAALKASRAEAEVKLGELQKQLAALGNDSVGIIGELLKAFEEAKAEREAVEAELNVTLDPVKTRNLESRKGVLMEREKSSFDALQGARKDKRGLQGDLQNTQQFLAGNQLPQEATLDSLMGKVREAWTLYGDTVARMDVNQTFGKGLVGVFEQSTTAMSTFFTELASRSKTGAEAIKGFAISVIKAMMDVLAQALAMQVVKGILSMFGMPMMGSNPSGFNGTLNNPSAYVPAATGGLITGGIPGRDSVPIMGMPGEVIIPKPTVDAVGADYLLGLNARTANTVGQGQSSMPAHKARQPDLTNVWIVAPDAKPTMGPKDIVMVIADDMMRGGQTKQLVRQIQTGAA